MKLPITLVSKVDRYNDPIERTVTLHREFTILLGPNGSGKTHLLRGLKVSLVPHVGPKKVRFLSAGRMGLLERFRSDYDGQRGGNPEYEAASFGGKRDADRRHQMETFSGDFQTLSERPDILIKVQERLRKLFRRELTIDWDAGALKVVFSRLDSSSRPYSSGREASGLMQLVGILAALYDDEVGALLLDEPEVSLHPQLQAFLLREMIKTAGIPAAGNNKKIIIIATHSTEMLRIATPADLLSLVFCHELDEEPRQISPEAGELKSRSISTLISRLGQEHKLSLFCKRPLLVEGPSDAIICSALAAKLDIDLEASGSQLLPVIGKGQMPTVAKLFRLFGKKPVVLADADALTDGTELAAFYLQNETVINESVAKMGYTSPAEMIRVIYGNFAKQIADNWDSISGLAENHPYWIGREGDVEKAKRRSAFCALFIAEAENTLIDQRWLNVRHALSSLLRILEQVGCFILRRGTIESYFLKADRNTTIGKPAGAAEEMEHIHAMHATQVSESYQDVLRCLRYAAPYPAISETEAIRDLLLAVSAPAVARIGNDTSADQIEFLSRSLIGNRSKIFEFKVIEETLSINIKSSILQVRGFPLVLRRGDDVIKVVNEALSKVSSPE